MQLQLIMHYVGAVSPKERLQIYDSCATDDVRRLGFTHKAFKRALLLGNPTLGSAPLVWLANDEDYATLGQELRQSIERLAASYCKPTHALMQGSCDHFLIIGHIPQAQDRVEALEDVGLCFKGHFSRHNISVSVKSVFITAGLQARPVADAVTSLHYADDPLLQYLLVVFNIGHGKAKAPAAAAQVNTPVTGQQVQQILLEKPSRKRGAEGSRRDMPTAKKQRRATASNAAHAEGAAGPSTFQHVSDVANPYGQTSANMADHPSASQQPLHRDNAAQMGVASDSSAADVGVRMHNRLSNFHFHRA